LRSCDGLGMQLGYPTVHRVVRSYFDGRLSVVLIMTTNGVSHRYLNFINGNINSSCYLMAILRRVIPVVCRKTNGEVNISHENTTVVVWMYDSV